MDWNVEFSDEVKSKIIKDYMDRGYSIEMTDQGMVMIPPLTYKESLEYQIQELQVDLMLMRESIMKKYCA